MQNAKEMKALYDEFRGRIGPERADQGLPPATTEAIHQHCEKRIRRSIANEESKRRIEAEGGAAKPTPARNLSGFCIGRDRLGNACPVPPSP